MNARTRSVLMSSATEEWSTPAWLYDALCAGYAFSLDPCSIGHRKTCDHFTKDQNGLLQPWTRYRMLVNPPFSKGQIKRWIEKAHRVSRTVACGAVVRRSDAGLACDALFDCSDSRRQSCSATIAGARRIGSGGSNEIAQRQRSASRRLRAIAPTAARNCRTLDRNPAPIAASVRPRSISAGFAAL